MDRIPREVEVAVRAAGESTGGYAGELSNVYRRARRRRNGRRAAAVATAMAVVLGIAGGGFLARRHEQVSPPFQPAVQISPSGAQRLFLPGAKGPYRTATSGPVYLNSQTQVGELLPDGGLRPWAVAGADSWITMIGLPDGRVVALGTQDFGSAPRVPGSPDPDLYLSVVSADGSVQSSRTLRPKGDHALLVAATATMAYLWRPQGLVQHELSTGLERLVITTPEPEHAENDPLGSDLAADPLRSILAADMAGDRLVVAQEPNSCRPMLLDLPSLSGLRDLPLTSRKCMRVIGLQLSPSTGRVAMTYHRPGSTWVAVLSTEDGTVLADRQVATHSKTSVASVNVAWTDDRNLRGVVVPLGPGTQTLTPFTIAT